MKEAGLGEGICELTSRLVKIRGMSYSSAICSKSYVSILYDVTFSAAFQWTHNKQKVQDSEGKKGKSELEK